MPIINRSIKLENIFKSDASSNMRILVLSILIVNGISVDAVSGMQNGQNQNGNFSENRILSRRRRYLVFPDGSSLQLVYDQIIPIVDYTNLLIMGVTVALAWRLPDQPDFREKTEPDENRKTFKLNRKQDNSTKTMLAADHYRPYYVHNDRKHYHDHRINLEYENYLIEKSKQQQMHATSNWNNAKWYAVIDKNKNGYRHRIYPVLLKRRSITQQKMEKHLKEPHLHVSIQRHTQYHRKTRFSLYQSIEKYLNARGHNGKQCIQLAICETANRTEAPPNHHASSDDPQSFIKELMRVIFSLPTTLRESNPSNATELYDAANNIEGLDCAKAFPKCTNSIWSDDFVF